MDIRKLQHVVALAEKQSYSRAAESLGLTQSALTRSIQALEQELGLRLFDRSRAGVGPTKAGKQLVADGQALLRQMRSLERNMELFANEDSGEVAFGLVPLPASIVLPDLLTRIAVQRRGLRVRTRIAGVQQLLAAVTNDELDFAILPRMQIEPAHGFSIKPVGWLHLVAMVRPGHPLAGRTVTEAVFEEWPVIGVSSLEDPDVAGGPRAEPTITCDSQEVLRTITMNSDAIWLTAQCATNRELVALGGLKLEQDTQIVAVSPAGRTLSPAALKIIAACSTALAAGL